MIIGIIITTVTAMVSEATGVVMITSMNLSELARTWPGFETDLRPKASLLVRKIQPRFGAIQQEAKALERFIPA